MKKLFCLMPALLFVCCSSLAAKKTNSLNAALYGKTTAAKKQVPQLFSLPGDYFRSRQIGDWNDANTWQSSPDSITWSNATLVPTGAANYINIRNSHTVTVSSNQDMDQVIIENGGQLQHTGGLLTINDGTGDDVTVFNGGVFTLSLFGAPPFFLTITADVKIKEGGILRVSAGGMTGNGTGVNAANFIYQNGSILELTVAYSTDGVTYFPNVAADTIPVFRSATNLAVGASGTTTFKGIFEAATGLTIQGSGQKIFRNGITGVGNISGAGSGKFIINGNSAILGGSGLLTVPAAGGLEIGNGSGTNVSLISGKTITNNITLLNNTFVFLNDNDLTLNGIVNGGSVTRHIVTGGLGKLVINNIGATPVIFPIGAEISSFNPLTIFDGGGLDYGARIEVGINPAIAIPLQAVNRTWFVTAFRGNPVAVHVNFFYTSTDCNTGWSPPPATLELGLYTAAWNVIESSLAQTGAGPYTVATNITGLGNGIESPLVLANIGAILATDHSVSVNYFNGSRQNSNSVLNWKLTCNSTAVNTDLERSKDGVNFATIFSVYATALQCGQPFYFTDQLPMAGTNFYRLKMKDDAGKITYSRIISINHPAGENSFLRIVPNPVVNGLLNLEIISNVKTMPELVFTDIFGRIVQKRSVQVQEGYNSFQINVRNLSSGVYLLYYNISSQKTVPLRFTVQ